MNDLVFDDYGIRIISEDGRMVAEYDSGESAGSHLIRHYISDAQAEQAMRSEHDAYLLAISLEGTPEVPSPNTVGPNATIVRDGE
ncbi:hypothetical protein HMP09_0478 [Sphingomonas sp. HMP9]|uniref:hypothetical protein n=1 Tax=Sphingomonas sp. HMP9 TaxID=1517554 RepID=UPI00159690D9|nr:hypothetical protein [Sphingomonas sp. HMP9]BCA61244.1 hypothetical protein HMP09_0478 [Sphingomonas sp. HMP9]